MRNAGKICKDRYLFSVATLGYAAFMKKAILGLLALTAVSTASAADYVGVSVGSGASIHYQRDLNSTSAMRYSLNLDAVGFSFNTLSLGGSVDYLADIPGAGGMGGFVPYYGLGLGAGVALGGVTGVSVYPHGTLGLSYQVTDPLSVFVEGNAGPAVTVSTGGTGIGFGFGARVGLNYMLGN